MDKFKELILRKPNEIIEVINRPLSTMSWNAYNFILTKLQEKRTNQIIISPAEILKAIGATNLHEELYKCLDELQKTQVSSIDKKGKLWGGFVLLSAFKKKDVNLFFIKNFSTFSISILRDTAPVLFVPFSHPTGTQI